MKTELILALALSVLAADGYDRTGSAAFTSGSSAAVASNGNDQTGSAASVADGSDYTDAASLN
jgi:hypothetical protein